MKRLILVLCVITLVGSPLATQASPSYEELLRQLTERRDTPEYPDLLLRTIESVPTVSDLETVVDEHLSAVTDPFRRGEVLMAIGEIYEIANRIDSARRYYGEAHRLLPEDDDIALRFAGTTLEIGNGNEAIFTLNRIVSNPDSPETQRAAARLRSRAYYLTGEPERALRHAVALAGFTGPESPVNEDVVDVETLTLLAELARVTERNDLLEYARSTLERRFPDAPETALIADGDADVTIGYFPNPSRIIELSGRIAPTVEVVPETDSDAETNSLAEIVTETDRDAPTERRGSEQPDMSEPTETETEDDAAQRIVGIQTGSFRDRENAEYMVLDIERYEIPAEIRPVVLDGVTYYRVIVPVEEGSTIDDAQERVIALKERGIEGFLIFAE